MSAARPCCWRGAARRCSRSARSARTTAGRSPRGSLVGDTVRCPWHHACFSLRTGEALRAPALNPVSCWRVERQRRPDLRRATRAGVGRRSRHAAPARRRAGIGRHRRRRRGGQRRRRDAAPRGLRRPRHDAQRRRRRRPTTGRTCRRTTSPATRPRSGSRCVRRSSTQKQRHRAAARRARRRDRPARRAACTLADGATARLTTRCCSRPAPSRCGSHVPGGDLPHVHYLRTLADSRAIIASAREREARAWSIGASFIGLEVAASLRARKLEVHVVAPEARPLERVLGPELGEFMRQLHEEHGVVFHLGTTAGRDRARARHARRAATTLAADLVVVGIGVRPATRAGRAGRPRRSTAASLVDEYLRDQRARHLRGRRHRALARPAQRRAHPRRALGRRRAPGADGGAQHAWAARALRRRAVLLEPALRRGDQLRRPRRGWDRIVQDGDPGAHDAAMRFEKGGRVLAVATIFRGRESLLAELAMEQGQQP